MGPHDSLVKNFWSYVILRCIRDSAMSRSYAHFWSLYSWDHSLNHELDPTNISAIACGQCLWSQSHRQYRNCAQITVCAVLRSHVFGLLRICTSPTHVSVTWESCVTSSITWAILMWHKQKNSSWTPCLWCSVGLDRESRIMQRLFYTPL